MSQIEWILLHNVVDQVVLTFSIKIGQFSEVYWY